MFSPDDVDPTTIQLTSTKNKKTELSHYERWMIHARLAKEDNVF